MTEHVQADARESVAFEAAVASIENLEADSAERVEERGAVVTEENI